MKSVQASCSQHDLHYFNATTTAMPPPPLQFDLYLCAASNILLLAAAGTSNAAVPCDVVNDTAASVPITGEEIVARGTFLTVFLHAYIVQVETLIYRRGLAAGAIPEAADVEGEKIAPGGITLVRTLAKRLQFLPNVVETRHNFTFNDVLLEFDYIGSTKTTRTAP